MACTAAASPTRPAQAGAPRADGDRRDGRWRHRHRRRAPARRGAPQPRSDAPRLQQFQLRHDRRPALGDDARRRLHRDDSGRQPRAPARPLRHRRRRRRQLGLSRHELRRRSRRAHRRGDPPSGLRAPRRLGALHRLFRAAQPAQQAGDHRARRSPRLPPRPGTEERCRGVRCRLPQRRGAGARRRGDAAGHRAPLRADPRPPLRAGSRRLGRRAGRHRGSPGGRARRSSPGSTPRSATTIR